MAPWRSAAARSAASGLPSARALREEVFEQDRRGPRVDIARAPDLSLARGVAFVVQAHGKPQLRGRDGETPDALGLMALLAAEGQRQPDHERIDLLVARDPLDLGEVLDNAPSDERPQRSAETVRVIAHGEADTAIADVQREIAHPLGDARGRRQRFDLDRDARV